MFISPAYAQAATAAAPAASSPADLGLSLLPVVLALGVFYLFVMRPQNKQAQAHRDMVSSLQKGDKVITGGGFVATVVKLVDEKEVLLKLSEGVEVTALRSTIMGKKPQ